jgi:acetyl-CoA synthetase
LGTRALVFYFTDVGDVTTLANPEIVEDVRNQVHARGSPRELSPHEEAEIKVFGQPE